DAGAINQGKLQYLAPGAVGPVTMQFKVQDDGGTANGGSDTALASNTITFNVVANTAPAASNLNPATNEDVPGTVILAATDAENDGLTYAIVTPPQHGALSGTAPNLIYTPAGDYNGTDSFSYKANDGLLDSNVANVSITIAPVDDAPVATN